MIREVHRVIRVCCLAWLTAVLAWPGVARAQAPADVTPDPDPTLYATFGLDGQVVANRWNHLRALIQPGQTPINGTVRISMGVGNTTMSSSSAPFVSVPGVPTRVDQIVPLPRESWYFMSSAWVRVSLYADDGREIRRLMMDGSGQSTSLRLPQVVSSGTQLVGNIGRISLDAAAREWSGPGQGGTQIEISTGMYELWSNVISATVEAEALPMHEGGYDALSAIVIASAQLDKAEDASLAALMEWLRGGGRLIVVGPLFGRDLARWGLEELIRSVDTDMSPAGFEILPEGHRRGWREIEIQVPTGPPLPSPDVPLRAASGAVGLGRVVYLRSDPSGDDRFKLEAAWRAILADTLTAPIPTSSNFYGTSNDDDTVPDILDWMADSLPTPGTWPMVLLVIFALGLAALLGPVDWAWLKRRRLSQWAWATAMGWIAIAATIAFLWPNVLRAGNTQLRRIAVVDSISLPGGGVEAAWKTGVTSMLTSSSGSRRFNGIPDGTMWRRVRAQESEAQRPMSVYTNQVSGAMPGPIGMDIWTFNGFRDDSVVADGPWASISVDGSGYSVELHGIPESESLTGMLQTAIGTQPITLTRDDAGTLRGTAPHTIELAESQGSVLITDWYSGEIAANGRAHGIGLPGVRDRGATMSDLIRTGRWAVLQVTTHAHEADIQIDEGTASEQTTTYRILVPLPDADAAGVNR